MIKPSSFKPPWWLRNPHLQTVWGTLFRRKRRQVAFWSSQFTLSDGDLLELTWAGKGSGPIIILLHGLEGSADSPYADGLLAALAEKGYRAVVMHFRCCGKTINRLPRSYHAGDTKDLAEFIVFLQQQNPGVPLFAVGFSLGGNVLLKWLGETGKENPLRAAVAVSVPFDLAASVAKIEKGFSRLYQHHFLKALRFKIQKKRGILPSKIIYNIKKIKTLRQFDDLVTAPLHGFRNADEYYRLSSSKSYLPHIGIPTLLIQAKDDPFMTKEMLPTSKSLSPTTTLELADQGGHVGFVTTRHLFQIEYWLEKRILHFFMNEISY